MEPQVLWAAVTALAGVIYKMMIDRLKEKDDRILALETDLKANNQQLAKNTEALNSVASKLEDLGKGSAS